MTLRLISVWAPDAKHVDLIAQEAARAMAGAGGGRFACNEELPAGYDRQRRRADAVQAVVAGSSLQTGSVSTKDAPPPGVDRALMSPPWSRASSRER